MRRPGRLPDEMTPLDDLDMQVGELPEVRPLGADGVLVSGELWFRGQILGEDDDYYDYLDNAYQYEAQVVEKGIRDQVDGRAREYLSANGDAVWERVERALEDGRTLLAAHPGASLVSTMTAAELTVRFLLLRPMLAGLVIEPRLAEHLASEATRGLTGRDREILPSVCQAWEIELGEVRVGETRRLWPTLGTLWEVRHSFVHKAQPVTPEDARLAIDCASALLTQVLEPLAARLGLAWPKGPFLHGFEPRRDPLAPSKGVISPA